MASNLKRSLISSLAVLVFLWVPIAWAVDSTAGATSIPGPFFGHQTPSTSANQPFLLDTGYADARNIPSFYTAPALGEQTWPGAVWNPDRAQVSVVGVPYSLRLIMYSNPRLCPATFKPVVTVTPYKSIAEGSESMRACADNIGVYNGERYSWGVWVNTATPSGGGLPIPATSFYWSIFCYPMTTYAAIETPPIVAADDTGACGPAVSSYARTPLFWDAGFISFPTGGNPHVVNTFKACPSGYLPYAAMASTKTFAHNPNDFITGGGICVQNVSPSGSGYQIAYYTNNRYTTQTQTNFTNVVPPGGAIGTHYLSNITNSSHIAPPNSNFVTSVTNTQNNNATDSGGIQWFIYCYQPGTAPPLPLPQVCSAANPFN